MEQNISKKIKIGVFSSSSDLGSKYLKRVKATKALLEAEGYEITLGKLHNKSIGYTSGTISARAQEFNALIQDHDLLMSMIGGYNSSSILSLIDYQTLKVHQPKVMGYSDTTALLLAIYQKTNLPVYYGPSFLASFYENEYIRNWNLNGLKNVVLNDHWDFELQNPLFYTEEKIDWASKDIFKKKLMKNELISFNDGIVVGRIIGGNLNTIISIYHTEYMPKILKGDILFIEDSFKAIDECEREFAFLLNNKIIDLLGGIIIGKCEGFDSMNTNETYESLFMKIIKPTCPVLAKYDCGHTHPMNIIKIGSKIELNTFKKTIRYFY
ncbi:MAG: LD-carboxypeptidase [Mycoplasmoidaceae bacterium]